MNVASLCVLEEGSGQSQIHLSDPSWAQWLRLVTSYFGGGDRRSGVQGQPQLHKTLSKKIKFKFKKNKGKTKDPKEVGVDFMGISQSRSCPWPKL